MLDSSVDFELKQQIAKLLNVRNIPLQTRQKSKIIIIIIVVSENIA